MENKYNTKTTGEQHYKITLVPCRTKKHLQNGHNFVLKLKVKSDIVDAEKTGNRRIKTTQTFFNDRLTAMRHFLFLTCNMV